MEKLVFFFFPPFSFFPSAKPIIVESLGRNSTHYRKNAAEFKARSACVCVMADDFIRFLQYNRTALSAKHFTKCSTFSFFRIKCCQTRLPNWIAVMESKR